MLRRRLLAYLTDARTIQERFKTAGGLSVLVNRSR